MKEERTVDSVVYNSGLSNRAKISNIVNLLLEHQITVFEATDALDKVCKE